VCAFTIGGGERNGWMRTVCQIGKGVTYLIDISTKYDPFTSKLFQVLRSNLKLSCIY
jgi:hypothetical protein